MSTLTLLDAAIVIAAQAHAGQRRKYTGVPYIQHPLEVVQILMQHGVDDEVMLAAAVLHDLLEDCEGWNEWRLHSELYNGCVSALKRFTVVRLVNELTEPQHQGNRATRKAAERERLSRVSPDAATIKYGDMISNTSSIAEHDPNFAVVYLREKLETLKVMTQGQYSLWDAARMQCNVAADRLGVLLEVESV